MESADVVLMRSDPLDVVLRPAIGAAVMSLSTVIVAITRSCSSGRVSWSRILAAAKLRMSNWFLPTKADLRSAPWNRRLDGASRYHADATNVGPQWVTM
jgi:hypothetical protein